MGRAVLEDGARSEQTCEFIEMYDYRTACRNRAYGFGALAGMVGVIGNAHWLGWRRLGARHYSTIINAWMIYRNRVNSKMNHLIMFFFSLILLVTFRFD